MPSFNTSGQQAFVLAASIPTGSNVIGAVTQSGTWNIGTLTSITNAVTVQDGGGSITVDNAGTFAVQATQSGAWNITNISGTVSLPTGAATAAKQPALGTAGTASADVITVQGIASMTPLLVNGSGVTQPISAASLPLPTGAATAAKQPALGTAGTPSADVLTVQGINSMTALKVDGSAVTQPVSDGGGSLTVDGTVAATQSGTWNVGLNAGTNAIGKLAANSGVDIGDVDVTSVIPGTGATNLGKAEDAAHTTGDVGVMALAVRNDAGTALAGTTGDYIPLSTDSTGALRVTGGGGGNQYTQGDTQASPVGTVAMGKDSSNVLKALPLDASGYLQVNVAAGGGSGGTSSSYGSAVPSTGTAAGFSDGTNMQLARVYDTDSGAGTQYTLGVSLRKTASGGSVELGTSSDPVRVDPTGTTAQPVTNTGTFAVQAAQSGTWNVGTLTSITNAVAVTDNSGSLTVDNAGTFATQDSQSITDNAAFTDGTSKVFMNGYIFDEVAGTALTENDAAAARIDSKRSQVAVIEDSTTRGQRLAVSSAGAASANTAQIAGTTTATGNGTASAGCQRVTIASDNTAFTVNAAQATASSLNAQVVGNVAHDGVDSGNPVKVGGVARTANPTAVAGGYRADMFMDDVGRPVVVMNQCRDLVGNQQTTITSSTTETTIVTAGGSGVFNDLTSLAITNSSTTALIVTLKDSTAGTTRGIYAIAANGGIVLTFPTPKAQGTANNNWTLTCGTSVASIYVVAEFVKNV